MPYPCLLHLEPLPLQQSTADLYLTRRPSNTVLSQSVWGLWVLVHTRYIWALWASLVDMLFDSKCDFARPTILLGLLLCLGCGVSPQCHPSAVQPPLQHHAAAAAVPTVVLYHRSLLFIYMCVYVSPSLPIYSSHLLIAINFFSISVILFLFCR